MEIELRMLNVCLLDFQEFFYLPSNDLTFSSSSPSPQNGRTGRWCFRLPYSSTSLLTTPMEERSFIHNGLCAAESLRRRKIERHREPELECVCKHVAGIYMFLLTDKQTSFSARHAQLLQVYNHNSITSAPPSFIISTTPTSTF